MTISISGFVFVNDMDSSHKSGTRKNHAKLKIKNVAGTYIVYLKKFVVISMSRYLLSNLDSAMLYKKEEIVLKFVKPNHEVLVISDDDQVKSFIKDLRSLYENPEINIGKPLFAEALGSFEHIYDFSKMQKFDTTRLSTVALENCNLPHLPEGIGHLALSSLSLNNSRINISKNGHDLFWDWMTKHNISTSLTVLKMNSIGLNKLPFEIIHLKRLQTLEVSSNKLARIPHFIGELPELVRLKFDGNLLSFLPDSIFGINDEYPSICYNRLIFFSFENDDFTRLRDVPKLSDLSVLSLIKNDVKFKRQEIPRPLWNSYDFVCRCKNCKKLFVFNEKYQGFYFSDPDSCQVPPLIINWQFFKCLKCNNAYT